MVFNSNVFLFVFLPVVFSLFWLSSTKRRRYVVLTVSGYVFYGYWDWRYCFLLAVSTLTGYVGGLMVQRCTGHARKTWAAGSIAVSLATLGFFKYYDFGAATINDLAGGELLPVLHVVLPIGISFYTFHTLSYILDSLSGRTRATSNIWEYATYVGLFSQLVAGPIVRFGQIESDLDRIDRQLTEADIVKGIGFFAVGMVKKVIVADTLARYVDPMLSSTASMSSSGAWAAALGYSFQLYYDFSGYSDMAVGLGHLFKLRIPQNFNTPYRSKNIAEFWQRWHISLSTWFRDYLFLPLAYSATRRMEWAELSPRAESTAAYAVATIVTMGLCGLWHGASWTFVAWGLYHGTLLVLERLFAKQVARVPNAVSRLLTSTLVLLGWVLFRSPDFAAAGQWLQRLAGIGPGTVLAPVGLWAWIGLCAVASMNLKASWDFDFQPRPRVAILAALALFVSYLFMNGHDSVFLYYQF